jgi:hypothetical protein
MADYRAIVKHVRYWRGSVHRWSTSYQMTGALSTPFTATAAQTLLTADDKICYSESSGGVSGGTYECAIYAAGGGTPLASYTAFDWTTPASWIAYASTAWPVRTVLPDTNAENALLVEWPAGFSSSGKPVKFRKWYHAVPQTGGVGNTVDVSTSVAAGLATQANNIAICLYATWGVALGTSGRSPGTVHVSQYYGNHQMPRGRRRKALVSANGTYNGPTVQIPSGGLQLD